MDAAALGAFGGRRAGLPVSGHSVRTTDAVPGEAFWRSRVCCVRQNHVGLTSVADVKPAEAKSDQPVRPSRQSAGDGDKNRIRRRGELGISRQTIAQGMPECFPLNLYARARHFLLSCVRDRGGSVRPGIPCALLIFGGKRMGITRAKHAARMRRCVSCR